MQINEKLEVLADSLKEYADIRYELLKLEIIDQSSSIISGMISSLIIISVLVLFTFFGSFYVAYYLSDLLQINYIGFAIVAGFYLLLAIFIYITKKNLIEKRIIAIFIKSRITIKTKQTSL